MRNVFPYAFLLGLSILLSAAKCGESCTKTVNNEDFCGNKKIRWILANERVKNTFKYQDWQLMVLVNDLAKREAAPHGVLIEVIGMGEIDKFGMGTKVPANVQSEHTKKIASLRYEKTMPSTDGKYITVANFKFKCADEQSEVLERLRIKTSFLNKTFEPIGDCNPLTLCLTGP